MTQEELARVFCETHARDMANAIASVRQEEREKYAKLRDAVRRAGFSVMETSGDWSIHCATDVAKKAESVETRIISRAIELEATLKPFAKYGAACPKTCSNADHPSPYTWFSRNGNPPVPTVGDCRAAATLLATPYGESLFDELVAACQFLIDAKGVVHSSDPDQPNIVGAKEWIKATMAKLKAIGTPEVTT